VRAGGFASLALLGSAVIGEPVLDNFEKKECRDAVVVVKKPKVLIDNFTSGGLHWLHARAVLEPYNEKLNSH
jgi:hypothetical protein